MVDKIKGERISLDEPVVMVYPYLFEARKYKGTGDAKFDATFLFKPDSADLLKIKKAQMAVARGKWPDRNFADPERPFRWAHQNGAKWADKKKREEKDGEFARDFILLKAKSKFDVAIGGIEKGAVVDFDIDQLRAKETPLAIAREKTFYSGTLVLASFTFAPFAGDLADGITTYLNQVVTLNKGSKIGSSGSSVSSTFKGYIGSAVAENPMGDDEMADI